MPWEKGKFTISKTFLSEVIGTSTFRHSLVTLTGVFVNGILGMFFYILLARILGASDYGIITVAIAVLTLTSDIADLGTNTGLVRHVSKFWDSKRIRALKYLKLGLEIKIFAGVVVTILGIILAPLIAETLFNKTILTEPLRYAFLGVLFTLLFSYASATLQATQQFKRWSVLQITTNAIRLIVLIVLGAIGIQAVNIHLGNYIFIPLLGFFIAMAFFVPHKIFKVKKEWRVGREFFKYNKWIALFTLVAAFSSRLDTFISARLLTSTEVGYYGAANQLTQVIPQIVGAIGIVLAPKMAAQDSITKAFTYINKSFLMVLAIAGFLIVGGLIATPVIPLLYGSEYLAIVPIFWILLVSMLIFLLATPYHSAIFYYFAKPSLFLWISLGHLVIITIVGWFLISDFGTTGAAITVLLGQLWNFVVPFIWVNSKRASA